MKKTNSLTPDKIIKTLAEHMDEIGGHGVRKIGLFGSFLKKTQHEKSDIDLLVEFAEPTFDNYMELKFMLESLFHRKVDLVVKENLKPALQYIKKEVVYA